MLLSGLGQRHAFVPRLAPRLAPWAYLWAFGRGPGGGQAWRAPGYHIIYFGLPA
jgi:hypothetical protein